MVWSANHSLDVAYITRAITLIVVEAVHSQSFSVTQIIIWGRDYLYAP